MCIFFSQFLPLSCACCCALPWVFVVVLALGCLLGACCSTLLFTLWCCDKTAAGLRCVVPFGHSFPSMVTLSCSAKNCLRNRCGVA